MDYAVILSFRSRYTLIVCVICLFAVLSKFLFSSSFFSFYIVEYCDIQIPIILSIDWSNEHISIHLTNLIYINYTYFMYYDMHDSNETFYCCSIYFICISIRFRSSSPRSHLSGIELVISLNTHYIGQSSV